MASCMGTGEIITLVLVIIIVFSASRMGQLGNALGKLVYSFRKASRGDDLVDAKATRLPRGTEDAQVVDEKPPKAGPPA